MIKISRCLYTLLFAALLMTSSIASAAQEQDRAIPADHAYIKSGPALLQDPRLTPGVVRTTNAKEICAATFHTAPYRKTTQAVKNKAYLEYGVVRNKGICKGGCEVDHLIPLELGGLDDIKNLWPQPSLPAPGFHEKDKLENYLRAQVCAGKLDLTAAQTAIRTDWYAAYVKAGLKKP